jgi:hypothetical protein
VDLPPYLQENLSKRLRERLEQFATEKACEGSRTAAHLLESVPYLQILALPWQLRHSLA